jgi:hypothetical protein
MVLSQIPTLSRRQGQHELTLEGLGSGQWTLLRMAEVSSAPLSNLLPPSGALLCEDLQPAGRITSAGAPRCTQAPRRTQVHSSAPRCTPGKMTVRNFFFCTPERTPVVL